MQQPRTIHIEHMFSPPAVPTDPPAGAPYKKGFATLGVRVPGFVVSPFVTPKTVFDKLLDHTSILKFIGQKFGPGGGYSDLVDKRPVGNVLDVLNNPNPLPAPAIPSLVPYLQKQPAVAGFTPGTVPTAPIPQGFQIALDDRGLAIGTTDCLIQGMPGFANPTLAPAWS